MRYLITLVLFVLVLPESRATGDSLRYLTPQDTVMLISNAYGDKFFMHQMERKQTLFSLAKFYGLSVEELYYYNPGLKENPVRVGQHIQVPIPNRAIRRYQGYDFRPHEYIPVYYRVRKGDTMYRIAKTLFRMEVEELMMRNQLEHPGLRTGQILHVGWMNINGIPPDARQDTGGPMAQRNQAMKSIYQRECSGPEVEQSGVACWYKDGGQDAGLYALHRYAARNAVVAVTNPMNNRTIYVKVVGKISSRAYEDNVKVVLSPLAAKLLGAVDPRFYVKVKHCR